MRKPKDRAERIAKLWLESSIGPEPDFIIDLLTDIRHYCNRFGIDFAHQDAIAYSHYIEENGKHREELES
jgi:hypothetical protein